MTTDEATAHDPSVDPGVLATLAQQRPDLQTVIVANPAAYDGLLQWIADYGTPEAQAAANFRLANQANQAVASEASVFSPPAPPTDVAVETVSIEDDTVFSQSRVDVEDTWETKLTASPTPFQANYVQPAPAATTSPLPTGSGFSMPTTLPPAPPEDFQAQPVATPMADSAPTQSAEKERGLGTSIALGALIGLLAAAIVIGALWLFVFRPSDSAPAAAPDSEIVEIEEGDAGEGEAASLVSETEQEEQGLDESDRVDNSVRFPAPATAVSAPWFMSETKNIACELSASGAICTIYEADFSVSAQGCSTPPYTLRADGTGANWDCTLPPVPNDSNGPVLMYSTSSSVANSACLSTARGMTCWDTVSGASFALSKQGFRFGSDGLIPETEFPWR